MYGLSRAGNLVAGSVSTQPLCQNLPPIAVKSERGKEICFTAAFGVVIRQQVIQDFRRRDVGVFGVGQIHCNAAVVPSHRVYRLARGVETAFEASCVEYVFILVILRAVERGFVCPQCSNYCRNK